MKRDDKKIGVECTKCGDRMFSISRHDFKWCKCHSTAVDGGDEYLKITGMDWQEIEMSYAKWVKTIEPPSKMSKEEYLKTMLKMFEG